MLVSAERRFSAGLGVYRDQPTAPRARRSSTLVVLCTDRPLQVRAVHH